MKQRKKVRHNRVEGRRSKRSGAVRAEESASCKIKPQRPTGTGEWTVARPIAIIKNIPFWSKEKKKTRKRQRADKKEERIRKKTGD